MQAHKDFRAGVLPHLLLSLPPFCFCPILDTVQAKQTIPFECFDFFLKTSEQHVKVQAAAKLAQPPRSATAKLGFGSLCGTGAKNDSEF